MCGEKSTTDQNRFSLVNNRRIRDLASLGLDCWRDASRGADLSSRRQQTEENMAADEDVGKRDES